MIGQAQSTGSITKQGNGRLEGKKRRVAPSESTADRYLAASRQSASWCAAHGPSYGWKVALECLRLARRRVQRRVSEGRLTDKLNVRQPSEQIQCGMQTRHQVAISTSAAAVASTHGADPTEHYAEQPVRLHWRDAVVVPRTVASPTAPKRL